MTSQAAFWDKAAPKYAKSDITDMIGYRDTLARTIRHLSPTDHVLELGCGTASTAMEIAPHVAHLTATDISPAMIDIGRENLWNAGHRNVTLKAAHTGDPSLGEGAPYDAILAFNLLHLVEDQDALLARARSFLKPGGLLITKTPCLGEKWFFKPMIAVMRAVGKAPYVCSQTLDDHHRAITDAGFVPIEELTQPGTPARLYMVARKL